MSLNTRIGYVLLEWPRYSETFILNELIALQPHLQPVHIFCLRDLEGSTVPSEFKNRVEHVAPGGADVQIGLREITEALSRKPSAFAAQMRAAHARYQMRADNPNELVRTEPLFAFACALRLLRRCRELSILHLHCHYAELPVTVATICRKLGGPTFSFTGHAKDIFTMDPARLARRIEAAKFAVSCSETGRQTMLHAAGAHHANKIHRVYHGIWSSQWKVDRAPTADCARMVSVGRLTPKKGFATLIAALAVLKQRGVNVHAEIIGEGREREPLLQQATGLGVAERLTLSGKLPQSDIRERFRTASAFVMPSIVLRSNNQDGIANALLEAMASGVPAIVSDIPALREVIRDRENGLVFESGNADSLADNIDILLNDAPFASGLAVAARATVEKLDCASAAQQLMELFQADAGH